MWNDATYVRMPVAMCPWEDASQHGDTQRAGVTGDSHFLCTFPVAFHCVPMNSFHFYNLKRKTIFIWGKVKSSGRDKKLNRTTARGRTRDRDFEVLGRREGVCCVLRLQQDVPQEAGNEGNWIGHLQTEL